MPILPKPVVIKVAYDDADGVRGALDKSENELTVAQERLIFDYPTVYIIHKPATATERPTHLTARVYVGETNDIEARTRQHRITDSAIDKNEDWRDFRKPETVMYVVGHKHFNKSLTLDVENRFMSYVLASDTSASLGITNGRVNPQRDYYTRDEFEDIVSQAWRILHEYDEELFPPERIIQNAAIFKASPFHKLSDEQKQAEEEILHQLAYIKTTKRDEKQLILVQGMAGTGKTVLLSHLFLEIIKQHSKQLDPAGESNHSFISNDKTPKIALVVNHPEQETVYNAIMKRLGLQDRNNEIVFMGTQFINKFSQPASMFAGQGGREHQLHPSDELDVVLIDEAHLLYTQGNQGYTGHRNQLWDILERAKTVIAVYDPEQVLRKSQELPEELANVLSSAYEEGVNGPCDTYPHSTQQLFGIQVDISNIILKQQFRIDACDEIIDWINGFASGKVVGRIPTDTKKRRLDGDAPPYEIRVFKSPTELYRAVLEKSKDDSLGLSRLVATYDWKYKADKSPNDNPCEYWAVSLRRNESGWSAVDDTVGKDSIRQSVSSVEYFSIPWNKQLNSIDDIEPIESVQSIQDNDASWAEKRHTIYEAGSIYTVQGFDLNYVGVIIGPSVSYQNGKIVFLPEKSYNHQAINGSSTPEDNLRHELNVLLKRGVHGLYLFAVDQGLQEHLLRMAT